MPRNIKQFQVVVVGESHIIYSLDDQGKLWIKNPSMANGGWQPVGA